MKRLLVIVAMLLAVSCTQYESGPQETEPGKVVGVIYSPATHSSMSGFTSGGHVVVGGSNTPEVKQVIFLCTHGRFVSNNESIWSMVREGECVTIYYTRDFEVTKASDGSEQRIPYDMHLDNVAERACGTWSHDDAK